LPINCGSLLDEFTFWGLLLSSLHLALARYAAEDRIAGDMIKRFVRILKDHEIIYNLVIKELKVRYRGSYLGFLYALLNPLVSTVVFAVVFTFIIRIKMQHYGLYLLTGFMPWIFFQQSLSESATSIIRNANLIKKVMIPREIFPISSILACLVNFFLGSCVMLPFLAAYGHFSVRWAYLPLVMLVHLVFTLGLGLFLSSANVMFRDIGNLVEIVIFVWFYANPIIYPLQMLQTKLQEIGRPELLTLYLANPMASIMVLYRHALFAPVSPDVLGTAAIIAIVWAVIALLVGQFVFSRLQKTFAKEL